MSRRTLDVLPAAERRITLRLLSYWERLRGNRVMPEPGDLDPDDIWDLWDNCFLLRADDLAKPDYEYAYLGQAIFNAYSHGLSEHDAGGMLSLRPSDLARGYAQVITTRRPLIEEGEFTNRNGHTVRYRQCLLPMGREKVEVIFGGMWFRIS